MKQKFTLTRDQDTEFFTYQMNNHIKKLSGSAQAAHLAFYKNYLSRGMVAQIAPYAGDKMQLTQKDNTVHSIGLCKSPIFYAIWTINKEIDEAASWYSSNFGGYSNVLQKSWEEKVFIENDCEVLVHITYSRTANVWVNVSIVPVQRNSKEFDFELILAIDLFNQRELKNLQSIFNH